MNTFVLTVLVAVVASTQAGFLHAPAPVVYHAPALVATPLISAQYPSYTVHSPAISPVIKTLASPVYSAPILHHATYAAAPVIAYGGHHGYSHGYGGHGHFHK